jgi:hypothetical protein
MGMPNLPRASGRVIAAVVVAIAIVFAVTGYALQGGAITAGIAPNSQSALSSGNISSGLTAGTSSSSSASNSPTTTSPQTESSGTIDRLVVFTGSMSLNVTNSSLVFQEVQNVAQLDGGYVSDSSIGPENGYGPEIVATAVVRVPADRFDQTMADLQGLGQVISAQTNSQDVTDSYVDLNASLSSYQKLLLQYESFMNMTTNVTDALAVQEKIDSVQQTIDSLTAQIQEMSNQVNLATITVTITEHYQAVAPPKKSMFGDTTSFALAFASVEASGAVFLTLGLSPLWVWLVPLLVIVRVLHRRRASAEGESSKAGPRS